MKKNHLSKMIQRNTSQPKVRHEGKVQLHARKAGAMIDTSNRRRIDRKRKHKGQLHD